MVARRRSRARTSRSHRDLARAVGRQRIIWKSRGEGVDQWHPACGQRPWRPSRTVRGAGRVLTDAIVAERDKPAVAERRGGATMVRRGVRVVG